MVNEAHFNDNGSQWEAWQKDKEGYNQWMTGLLETQKAEARTHGFHHREQYAEEISAMGED
jgi:hypothetical protein